MFSKSNYFELIFCILYFLSCSSVTEGQKPKNYGHSSLVLYQGAEREEVDAKDCPVGIAFHEPQIFSCACINGIWAFYDNPCEAPVAVIGGNNHCFKMPSKPISLAMAVSNPLKGLGESLTVFEDDMESMRSKIYRTLHMSLNNADVFVSSNTSWTLTSPDGTKSVCLANNPVFLGGENEESFPRATYCSFVDVSREIPHIGGISKGCNSTMELDPIQCQPILPPNGEEVCMDQELVAAYVDITKINIDPVLATNFLENEEEPTIRISRTLKNLGKFQPPQETTTKKPATTTTQTTTEHYAKAYKDEPSWHQRGSSNDHGPLEGMKGRSLAAPKAPAAPKDAASIKPPSSATLLIPVEEAWQNPKAFLMPPSTNSNQLVTNHLWMYQRMAIRNALNTTRLVPPDEEMSVQVDTGKVKKLLSVHADIMKKVCPLVPASIFDILTSTFLGILTKGFRWREPYVEQNHYLRILTALTLCKDSAIPMKFKAVQQCSMKGSEFIILNDKDSKGDVNVPLQILEVFKSENFEPVIEATWKTFISVHSYCFKDFSDQYQDHHKYTTLMMGLFTNQLHDIWMRNKTVSVEYAGVLGNIGETMRELEKCAIGSRMNSEYPFHMTRPTKLVRYKINNMVINRKKRNVPTSIEHITQEKSGWSTQPISEDTHTRKKRLAANSIGSDTKVQIMYGKGICLKKYSDSRTTVGSHCKKDGVKAESVVRIGHISYSYNIGSEDNQKHTMHQKQVDFMTSGEGEPVPDSLSLHMSPRETASRTFSLADEQTKDILAMLRHSVDGGELMLKQNNKIDNETQAVHIDKLIGEIGGKKEDSDDDDDSLNKADEERNEIRLARLAESRPKWLVYALEIGFHVMVFANFFASWYDSSLLLLEEAKMRLWLLQDDFNCLEIVNNVDWLDHTVNIMHALLSCSVLYVHNKNSAPLCLAWVFSQAAHMMYKILQQFYKEKFEKQAYADLTRFNHLVQVIMFDIIGALLLLHKYYDLTDQFKSRARYFGTTDTSERSINDRIIYRNDSAYLQRKTILREATQAQTYAIIKKIGKHARQGIPVEPTRLRREITAAKLALEDCETVENHNMMHILKKAYARRLKLLEDQVIKDQQQKMAARKQNSFERHPPIIQSEMY